MKHLPLLLIILLGLSLRFFDLGGVPVGFHRDEAYFGYNAYSLLLTGRDMTGNFLPLHIAAFIYSPAGYSYFSIPFILLFGLNEFSVRFVSALFGTATIPLVYLLVKRLFTGRHSEALALMSALFLAISPWNINLSRTATENVLVVFFIVLGVLLHLSWAKKQKVWVIILSFLCFGLTLFLYQAPRAFLPFFIPLLFLFFRPKDWKKQTILPTILFCLVIIFPIALVLSSHQLNERIRTLSIFQHPETKLILEEQFREDGNADSPLFVTRVFHNKVINYSATFINNYASYFSYDFLFTDKGFPDRYRVPSMGLLYLFELPFLVFGLWRLFSRERRLALFLTGWILLAPLGSAVTFHDSPNLQRTLIIFPALTIVSAYGFLQIWQILSKGWIGKFGKLVLLLCMLYGFCYYLHQYYLHQNNHRPWFRQEGYKEMIAQVNHLAPNYQKVVITDEETDPAIFFLFYNQYNPVVFQQIAQQKIVENYGKTNFANYEFMHAQCPLHVTGKLDQTKKQYQLSGKKGILYVNHGFCKKTVKDQRIQTISEITRGDGTKVFKLQVVR